jgi:N-glycosidase YbiA
MATSEVETIYFYAAREQPFGCFSNFSPHGFTHEGLWWPTSEHYFQAQKFPGTAYAQQIRLTKSPTVAARLGRSRKQPIRADWSEVKDDIMRTAVAHKFRGNEEIKQVLLSTGDAMLVENAPRDYYWGCGADGTGLNMLGRILMEVRAELQRQSCK